MPDPIKKKDFSTEFETRFGSLNSAQKKAVETIEGPVMVIAGPGTGKTTILTLRIANIIRLTDTAPESILALTFTESGALTMRRKLAEVIGPAAYRVGIHTFHGFAERIIQQYPDYFSRIIGSTVITEAEQIKIISKCLKSKRISVLRPYGDPAYYVKPILREIHLLKREYVSPKKFLISLKNEPELGSKPSRTEIEKQEKRQAKNLELALVYTEYESELQKQRYYDFDDMLLELIKAMESEPVFKLILQETYQYILADEHQDANASQNRILELLADFHDLPNLFIVGDDKQAIYRFQGASLENFLYFTKKYSEAVVIDLKHNYRSHQGILDASHSLILNNPSIPGRERQKLLSSRTGTRTISVEELPSKNQELEYLASSVKNLLAKGEKPEEIAVLYRENREAGAIAEVLKSHGLAYRIESELDLLDEPDVAALIMLCQAVYDPANSQVLGQALLLPMLSRDNASVMDIFARANREKISLYKLLSSAKRDSIGEGLVKKVYEQILGWSGDGQVLLFPNFLQKIIQETGLMASILSAPNSLERLDSVQSFSEYVAKAAQSKKTFRLKDFIEYIEIVREHGISATRSFNEHLQGIRLMTAHKSKGLEFNQVFIVNAVDGIWGNRFRRNLFNVPIIEHIRDTGRIEDERRLFYVAMTRARESVRIFYSRLAEEKEFLPSQFIAEIDPRLVSFRVLGSVAGPEVLSEDFGGVAIDKNASLKSFKENLNKNSILNSGFIRSKFFGQPFSVTHLNNYLKCPWEYFFVNLIRIPQIPTKQQMYGTAVHATLRTFFEAYKDERDFSLKKLLQIFRHNIDGQAMSSDDREDSFKKGKKALGGYYQQYNGFWSRRLLTEYPVRGVIVSVAALKLELTGKLDKIEFLNDREVGVVDYKTAKPKSRNEIEGKTSAKSFGQGDYKRQLVFYQILLDRLNKFKMKYGEIDFIEPNERDLYKKERFEVSSQEAEELLRVIGQVAEEVSNLSFVESSCQEKNCPYCRLGKILKSA